MRPGGMPTAVSARKGRKSAAPVVPVGDDGVPLTVQLAQKQAANQQVALENVLLEAALLRLQRPGEALNRLCLYFDHIQS